MTVILMEGFDHLSAAQLNTYKAWSTINAVTTGRITGQSATFVNNNIVTSGHALPTSYSEIICGFGFYTPTIPADEYFAFIGGSTKVARLNLVTSGPNMVFRLTNSAGTTLATGTTSILANTWYYVEVRVVVHASTGTVELRLNGSGSAECSGTGLNTGSTNIDRVSWGTANSQSQRVDDVYVIDPNTGSSPTNTWLGDARVETLVPNGNGANTAWTGVYTDWDDTTSSDDDTTYASSATPGDRETSTLTDLASAGTVFAVQTNLIARKDDAGARTIAPVIRISGVNYDGTTSAGMTTSYLDYTQLYDRLDPAGNAWTKTTIDAMEAGAKEVA
jgi:hypothetical protein